MGTKQKRVNLVPMAEQLEAIRDEFAEGEDSQEEQPKVEKIVKRKPNDTDEEKKPKAPARSRNTSRTSKAQAEESPPAETAEEPAAKTPTVTQVKVEAETPAQPAPPRSRWTLEMSFDEMKDWAVQQHFISVGLLERVRHLEEKMSVQTLLLERHIDGENPHERTTSESSPANVADNTEQEGTMDPTIQAILETLLQQMEELANVVGAQKAQITELTTKVAKLEAQPAQPAQPQVDPAAQALLARARAIKA